MPFSTNVNLGYCKNEICSFNALNANNTVKTGSTQTNVDAFPKPIRPVTSTIWKGGLTGLNSAIEKSTE